MKKIRTDDSAHATLVIVKGKMKDVGMIQQKPLSSIRYYNIV